MLILAIQANGDLFRFDVAPVMQTPKICEVAVKKSWKNLEYVKEECKTEELCFGAVKKSWKALEFVPSKCQTAEMAMYALNRNPEAEKYFKL